MFFQTVFNTELMRYTVATGEPVVTGFMRTRPGQDVLGLVLRGAVFPADRLARVGGHRGRRDLLPVRRAARGAARRLATIYLIGIVTFLAASACCCVGKRIARTLEMLNWVLVACILGGFLVLGAHLRAGRHVAARRSPGSPASTPRTARFSFLPEASDILLLGALVGYSGGGGVLNITLSNWARDKGYGMGSARRPHRRRGGRREESHLADTGFMFEPERGECARWRGWWRIVRVDQWGMFFVGAMLGMMLPALLYVTFVAPGTDIKGLAISAVLAQTIGATAGAWLGWSSRCSAHGSCSRRSSTASRA